MTHVMKLQNLYLPLVIMLLAACSGSDEEKILYPIKIQVGSTTHDFHYANGRVYSVTTNRPGYYEEITYRYYDDYFNEPEHRFKEKIFEVHYEPDLGPIGWDSSDSIKSRHDMLQRSDAGLVMQEQQSVYLPNGSPRDNVLHKYNTSNQLVASTYYFYDTRLWSEMQLNDPRYMSKQVKYEYAQGKLAKAAYYAPGAERPYLLIELTYDDKPGYLRHLPVEARFMPLELPYRDHNIVSYTVTDAHGEVRKDVSHTRSYSYNKDGYPSKFTQKMLDGKEIEGSIVYTTAASASKAVAAVEN